MWTGKGAGSPTPPKPSKGRRKAESAADSSPAVVKNQKGKVRTFLPVEETSAETRRLLKSLHEWTAKGYPDIETGAGRVNVTPEPETSFHRTPKGKKKGAVVAGDRRPTSPISTFKGVHLPNKEQTFFFGPHTRFTELRDSAYPSEFRLADVVYVCEFCLRPMLSGVEFKNHVVGWIELS